MQSDMPANPADEEQAAGQRRNERPYAKPDTAPGAVPLAPHATEQGTPPSPQGAPSGTPAMPRPPLSPYPEDQCVILIGMAAAGKSTMGRELSQLLGWVFVDSDNLIEAAYGARLQTVADALTKEEFLDMEETVIRRIRMQRCVIATGGSVVYRPRAVEHLRGLGPLLYLDVPLDIVLERIARKPDRGLAIAPGQTIEDLFNERRALYEKAATLRITGGSAPAGDYSLAALGVLKEFWSKK